MNEWTETDRLIERLEVRAIRNPEAAEKTARRNLREMSNRDDEARLRGFLAGLARREGQKRSARYFAIHPRTPTAGSGTNGEAVAERQGRVVRRSRVNGAARA